MQRRVLIVLEFLEVFAPRRGIASRAHLLHRESVRSVKLLHMLTCQSERHRPVATPTSTLAASHARGCHRSRLGPPVAEVPRGRLEGRSRARRGFCATDFVLKALGTEWRRMLVETNAGGPRHHSTYKYEPRNQQEPHSCKLCFRRVGHRGAQSAGLQCHQPWHGLTRPRSEFAVRPVRRPSCTTSVLTYHEKMFCCRTSVCI